MDKEHTSHQTQFYGQGIYFTPNTVLCTRNIFRTKNSFMYKEHTSHYTQLYAQGIYFTLNRVYVHGTYFTLNTVYAQGTNFTLNTVLRTRNIFHTKQSFMFHTKYSCMKEHTSH